MFVTPGILGKQLLHAQLWRGAVERLSFPSRMGPCRFTCGEASWEEPPRGRTVRQRLLRRRWRSFWEVLRIRYDHSIAEGCYASFTRMLNVCYAWNPGKATAPRPAVAWSSRKAFISVPDGTLPVYLRRSFLGRTTQSANSPTKAPAAAMAIILGSPPKSV